MDWLKTSYGRAVVTANAETRRKQAAVGEWWREHPDAWAEFGRYDSTAEVDAHFNIYDQLNPQVELNRQDAKDAKSEGSFEIKWIEVFRDARREWQDERNERDVTLLEVDAFRLYRDGVKQLEAHKRAMATVRIS